MQIQTFSIVTGTAACNAKCPFCVSRMTGLEEYRKPIPTNWRNFDIACRLAIQAGATTAMLTGKGEPTLWPNLIIEYLEKLNNRFPIIELQTNGIRIADSSITDETLLKWYELGLTTIAISVCHYDPKRNKEIYLPHKEEYPDLSLLIDKLHKFGFTVRLVTVMLNTYIDSLQEAQKMINFARANAVEQLTLLPVNNPEDTQDEKASNYVTNYKIPTSRIEDIENGLVLFGAKETLKLPHGATIYDVNGQNVCFNFCLSREPDDMTQLRNLIFFPEGRLRHRWDLQGSIIL